MATAMTAAIATIAFAQTSGTAAESEPAAGGNASPVQDTSGTEDDTSVETDPPAKSGTPGAVEEEMQSRFNDLRSELLDDRADYIDRWLSVMAIVLTFFGIVVAIAGFLGFRRFREIETEAKNTLEEIKKTRDKSHDILQGLTAEAAAENPDKAKRAVKDAQKNPKASLIDKAIANALDLQRQGKNKEAVEKWRAIASIAEGTDNNLAARAWVSVGYLVRHESLEDCISANDRVISLKPDYAEAYMNRGVAKKELGQHKAAIADHDEAIRLKPDLVEAYTNRGNAKSARGKHKAAIADHDEAIRLKPDLAEAYNNRGNAKQALGQHKDAIADYNEAIRLKPNLAEAYMNRGVANSARGEYEDAIADYNEAIRLKPDDAAAYCNRGNAKQALGLKDEARKDFETAIELARKANDAKMAAQLEQLLRDLNDAGGS